MQAAFLRKYGPPSVLEYGELPRPQPGKGQVLIHVHAASVNPVDWKTRRGMIRWIVPAKFPLVLGYDVSGVIVEVGEGVSRQRLGQPVFSFLDQRHGGGYAEYAVASSEVAIDKPANITHDEAAATPLAASTALRSLRDLGGIERGQRVLVNGASGGVGVFAVQLAKDFGAEVTGVASDKNLSLVRELGADHTIDYKQQDFTKTDVRYGIIFDAVASSSFGACRKILTPRGRYITTLPSPSQMLMQGVTKLFSKQRCMFVLARPNADDLQLLAEKLAAGTLRAIVDKTFPLAEIRQAHEYSEAGRARGKIVLRVSE